MTPEIRDLITRELEDGAPLDEAALVNGVRPGEVHAAIDSFERGVGDVFSQSCGQAFLRAQAKSVRKMRRKIITLAEESADTKSIIQGMTIQTDYVPVSYGALVVTPASVAERESARMEYLLSTAEAGILEPEVEEEDADLLYEDEDAPDKPWDDE